MDKQVSLIKQQFQSLLDVANKRFSKLHGLQARGDCAWSIVQPSFEKTFASFSRLWQFQLQHRPALLETGLQRTDLGSIASKIGQLYYNYYLRSGDTGALLESYTFYDAIQTRQYFASSAGSPDAANVARQLRFYARFIIVCLFLSRHEEAIQLMQEFQAGVSSYTLQFGSKGSQDWQVVLAEVSSLVAAHVATPLPRSPASMERPYKPVLRCSPMDPVAACAPHRSRLREAVLVSYRPGQVKVAELPLELYRMAQALEWQDGRLAAGAPAAMDARALAGNAGTARTEPASARVRPDVLGTNSGDSCGTPEGVVIQQPGQAFAPDKVPGGALSSLQLSPARGAGRCTSRTPPRQLLHRPTAQQLLSSLLSVTEAIRNPEKEMALLYLSADAAAPVRTAMSNQDTPPGQSYADRRSEHTAAGTALRCLRLCPHSHQRHQRTPGISMGATPASGRGQPDAAAPPGPASPADCLLSPEELLVATRRRLMLVLDSDMSTDFARLQDRDLGYPLLCLMSPSKPPPTPTNTQSRTGSLTTMALACPAQALCVLCGQLEPSPEALQRLQAVIDEELQRLGTALAEQLGLRAAASADQAEAGEGAAAGPSHAAAQAESPAAGCGGAEPATGAIGDAGCAAGFGYGAWAFAFQDVMIRRLILHFAFYRCCLASYRAGSRDAASLPSCFPELPPAADANNDSLRGGILRAVAALGGHSSFGSCG